MNFGFIGYVLLTLTVDIYLFNEFKNHVHTFIVNRNIPAVKIIIQSGLAAMYKCMFSKLICRIKEIQAGAELCQARFMLGYFKQLLSAMLAYFLASFARLLPSQLYQSSPKSPVYYLTLQPPIQVYQPVFSSIMRHCDNKTNSAQLQLEFGRSLAKKNVDRLVHNFAKLSSSLS